MEQRGKSVVRNLKMKEIIEEIRLNGKSVYTISFDYGENSLLKERKQFHILSI